jgi:hypothetical protein
MMERQDQVDLPGEKACVKRMYFQNVAFEKKVVGGGASITS